MSRQHMRHLQGLEDFEDFKYILPQQFTLNNGVEMPAIGLDTFKMGHFYTVLQTVDDALKAGYRMFDTAALYGNEVYLNFAFKKLLPKYKLKRGDIFIISKLLPCNYGGGAVTERAFHNTLSNLGLDYIDLYLVHNPLGGDSSKILLNDQTVLRVAENVGVTPAQVLLVWSLQQHISVIPKSVNPDSLKENITLRFNLSTEDIEDLNALGAKNIRFS